MTSKEIKKMFEIPHKFKQAEFQEKKKNTPNKKEKIQKGKTQTNKVSKKSKVRKEGTTKRIKL